MNTTQFVILIITAIVSVSGLVLSILNAIINKKNRRNSLREKVFQKQFDFFMKMNEFVALINHELDEFNQEASNNEESLDVIYELIEGLDLHVSKNEMIIPDELYKDIYKYVTALYDLLSEMIKDHSFLDKDNGNDVLDLDIDLQMDIINYLGLEKLSRENMELARGMRV